MAFRRRARCIAVLSASVLAFSLLIGCGGDDGDTSGQSAAQGIVRETVGKATAQDAYVALVVLEGAEPEQTEIVAYVCNAPGEVAELFRGLASEEDVQLTSDDGDARLRGRLTEEGAQGTVDLGDGPPLRFQTSVAGSNDASGLYEVSLYRDGTMVGTSWGNKRLKLKARPNNQAARGEVVLADGDSVPFEIRAGGPSTRTTGQARVIVLSDGTLRGSRTKSTGSTSAPFVDWILVD
jgi:hypothetical protein